MGSEFELQAVASKLFHEVTHQKENEFNQRLNNAQAFCKWAVKQQFVSEKDREKQIAAGMLLIGKIYEDLTVDQFLKLKFLFGQSRMGEDLKTYLSRVKHPDTSNYVSSIKKTR